MSDKNNEKNNAEEKAKQKLQKITESETKKAQKKQEKNKRKAEMDELYKQLDPYKGLTKEEKTKKEKEIKIKKEKEKINVRLAVKEAPVKMLKEINKIRWSSRKNLGQKFSWVIIFLIIFGIFFFAVDLGLRYLFILLRII